MRVVLAAVALGCISGAVVAVLRGNETAGVLFAFGFFVACWWFVAYISARRRLDNIESEERDR